jgi:hypothetical protein
MENYEVEKREKCEILETTEESGRKLGNPNLCHPHRSSHNFLAIPSHVVLYLSSEESSWVN